MRVRIIRLFLVAQIIGVVFWAASPVAAQSCDVVVDGTGDVDTAEVGAAAAEVAGADARVYLFDSVPGGDIEEAANEVIAACYSDGPGGRQIDLVLIAVSLGDRVTTIQYGAEHNVELGETSFTIQSDVINPRLADGDITAAMVDGLEAIDDALASDPGSDPEASGSENSSGDGSGPGGTVGLVMLGLIGASGAGIAVGRRRQLTADRNALEAASQQPLVDVGVARERYDQLRAQSEVWDRTVLGKTRDRLGELRSRSGKAIGQVDASVANYSRATKGGVGDLSREGLREATVRLEELRSATAAAQAEIDRFRQLGDRIERLRVTMPVKRESLREDIVESLELADQRESNGWIVDKPRQTLLDADRWLVDLDLDDLAIDTLAADAVIEGCEANLFAARHDLQTLPDRKAGLIEWSEELRNNRTAEEERASVTRSQLDALAAHHAPASIARAGSVDDVMTQLASSERDRVIGEQQIESQSWDAAAGNLESSGLWLIRADDLLDHMDDLIVSMETARAQAPALLEEIAEEINELDAFIHRHDRDLRPDFDVQPERAALALEGLHAELRQARPNHLRVAEAGSELARRIDAIFLQAREEQARVAALRREVAREQQRAMREIQRADKTIGWQLFGSSDRRALDRLEHDLAEQKRSLEEQLATAVEVRTTAARLRAKIIAKRRRDAGWAIGGMTTGGTKSGGGGGGFGGFSGGGGGFGGFGGGGFSGGGGGFGGGGSSSSW